MGLVECVWLRWGPAVGQVGTKGESLGVGALENTFRVVALVGARRVFLRMRYRPVANTRERSPASCVPPPTATASLYDPYALAEPSLGCLHDVCHARNALR